MNQVFHREIVMAKGAVLESGVGGSPCSLRTGLWRGNLTPPFPSHYHLWYSSLCHLNVTPESQGEETSLENLLFGGLVSTQSISAIAAATTNQKSLYVAVEKLCIDLMSDIPALWKFTMKEWDLAATALPFVFSYTTGNQKLKGSWGGNEPGMFK